MRCFFKIILKRFPLFLLLVIPDIAKAQLTTYIESKPISLSITKQIFPPILNVEKWSFSDSSNDNAIDADEDCLISLTISNSGMGDAYGVVANLTSSSKEIQGGTFNFPPILKGSSSVINIPIKASQNIKDGNVELNIAVVDQNGFGITPQIYHLETRAFKPPQIILKEWAITSDTGNTVERQKPFYLTLLIQNNSNGAADDVKMNVQFPKNTPIINGNENLTVAIGHLAPYESRTYKYMLVTNSFYTDDDIPVHVELSEKYGKYSENGLASIKLNQSFSATSNIIKSADNIKISNVSLSSDVDKNIPNNTKKNPYRYAIIFGNEDYHSYQKGLSTESDVSFAKRDALTFKDYCINTLGINEDNITCEIDATTAVMMQRIAKIIKLVQLDKDKRPEIIFYYAGHGFPDQNTREPYILPVDVSASNIQLGVKLSNLYADLASTGASKITVFMDACFSGGGRNAGLQSARGVKIKPREESLNGNIVVFSATSSDQVALPYAEQQHGMFTYFLLKKLQETQGNCNYQELSSYLKEKVGRNSILINNQDQNPQTQFSVEAAASWESWSLR